MYRALVLATILLLACQAPLTGEATSDDGVFFVALHDDGLPIRSGKPLLTLTLLRDGSPWVGADLGLSAVMPAHDHRTAVPCRLEEVTDGVWQAEIGLDMSGMWTLDVQAADETEADAAHLRIDVF
jgi:hypothetical protein